jgi:hypothetical protein
MRSHCAFVTKVQLPSPLQHAPLQSLQLLEMFQLDGHSAWVLSNSHVCEFGTQHEPKLGLHADKQFGAFSVNG